MDSDHFRDTGEPIAGSSDAHTAGNGAIMHLAPAPLAFARDPGTAERLGNLSRT